MDDRRQPYRLPTGLFVALATGLFALGAGWWSHAAPAAATPAPAAPSSPASDNAMSGALTLQLGDGTIIVDDSGTYMMYHGMRHHLMQRSRIVPGGSTPCRVTVPGEPDPALSDLGRALLGGTSTVRLPRCTRQPR